MKRELSLKVETNPKSIKQIKFSLIVYESMMKKMNKYINKIKLRKINFR